MLIQRIVDYAIDERASKLPSEVIHHARRALINWYDIAGEHHCPRDFT